jgi:hypothetical protein
MINWSKIRLPAPCQSIVKPWVGGFLHGKMCRLLPSGGSFLSPDGVGVSRLVIGFQRSNTCDMTSRDLLDDENDA